MTETSFSLKYVEEFVNEKKYEFQVFVSIDYISILSVINLHISIFTELTFMKFLKFVENLEKGLIENEPFENLARESRFDSIRLVESEGNRWIRICTSTGRNYDATTLDTEIKISFSEAPKLVRVLKETISQFKNDSVKNAIHEYKIDKPYLDF